MSEDIIHPAVRRLLDRELTGGRFCQLEGGVRETVLTLSQVQGLTTVSSCEGHGGLRIRPFHVRSELALTNYQAARFIERTLRGYYELAGACPEDAFLEVERRYYAVPADAEGKLHEQLVMTLVPALYGRRVTWDMRRLMVDAAARRLVDVVYRAAQSLHLWR